MPGTMQFPTLFKRSSSGAIQQWRVWVEKETGCGLIVTEHGQVDGKLQTGSDTIWKGKNVGRSNETDPYEQACLEAEAKWRKKQEREGYVADLERAQAGETDAEGGIAPMLAKPLEDVKNFKFPADYQRKFNGVRCIVEIVDGKVGLWSRKRKRILGVPHIQAAYERAFIDIAGRFVFDGELYVHGWALQRISGYVRKESTKPGFEKLGHFIYDLPSHPTEWWDRRLALETMFKALLHKDPDLHIVETVRVETMQAANELHDIWVQEGYEGGILRALDGKYEAGKRSSKLVKVKRFQDREYPIVSVSQGRGKFEGLAVFTCKTDEGKEFDCCAPGTFEDRAEFLRRAAELPGKLLTVKFFEHSEDGIPLFPVGMAVRDYE